MKNRIWILLLTLTLNASVLAQPYSSNQLRSQATQISVSYGNDFQLTKISTVNPMIGVGTYNNWYYHFVSFEQTSSLIVRVGTLPTSVTLLSYLSGIDTIPETIADSPVVIANAIHHFGISYSPVVEATMYTCRDYNRYWAGLLWYISIADSFDVYGGYFYLLTGEFSHFVNALEGTEALPNTFSLNQNYPNPFNPTTSLTYSLAKADKVKLSVFDATGREVAVLFEGTQSVGTHTAAFDATGLPTGVYFNKLSSSSGTVVKQMLLMK